MKSDMRHVFAVMLFLLIGQAYAEGGGKILGTAGTTSFEGGAGGGIVPWATLSGYDTREQYSLSGFFTRVGVEDYQLESFGAAFGMKDRIEFSVAHQEFTLKNLNTALSQNVFGAKVRLLGDAIYTAYPQISVGFYHKRLLDRDLAELVGADETTSGNDYYLSATKLHLGLASGFNVLWNLTARNTKANQTGFLGYGGDRHARAQWLFEGSAAILLSRNIAFGLEYRNKPNNLSFAEEEAWQDIFLAWFPNKRVNLTLAWADLGRVANTEKQRGVYLSLTAYGW